MTPVPESLEPVTTLVYGVHCMVCSMDRKYVIDGDERMAEQMQMVQFAFQREHRATVGTHEEQIK